MPDESMTGTAMDDGQQEPMKFSYVGAGRVFDSAEAMLDHLREEIRRTPRLIRAWWWICRRTKDAKRWFLHRFHPRHRNHVVKTGLKPGYWDTDTQVDSVLITLFREFVEVEKPFDFFDTEYPPNKEHWGRVKALYDRVKDLDVHSLPDDDELTPILHEIVDLRRHFWT